MKGGEAFRVALDALRANRLRSVLTMIGVIVGVAAVVVCGDKRGTVARGMKGLVAATDYAPEPRTGGWWPERKGECTIWYHRPPGLEQRLNRQERAANLSVSGEMLATERVRRSPSEFQRLPVVEKLPVDER